MILSPENPPVEEEVARIELEDEKPAQQIEELALSIDERTETPDGNNGSSCTNFFLIFTKLCILLENKEKKFGVRGTLNFLLKFRYYGC